MRPSSRTMLLVAVVLLLVLGACATKTEPAPVTPASIEPSSEPGATEMPSDVSATLFTDGNGWEPVIATDPSAPYVYAATTLKDDDCVSPASNCPRWNMALRRSDDNGATWGDVSWVCVCKGDNWVGDPQIRTSTDGTVFVAWLSTPGWTVKFSRSTDHGKTWSEPVDLMPADTPWIDHPWLAVSPDGGDVYVGYSKTYENWITTSNNGGKSFHAPVLINEKDEGYYYYESGSVAPDGTAYFFVPIYGCCPYGKLSGKRPIIGKVLRSTDRGRSWDQIEIARVPPPPPPIDCKGCSKAQYGMLGAIATDDNGNLAVAYNGRGPDASEGEQIWVRTSADQGETWTEPNAISPAGAVIAAFPAIAGTGDGDFRVIWTDDRNGADTQTNWNTYLSTSTDGGATWTEAQDISDGSGYDYQTPEGYSYFYGDYGDVQITQDGQTAAIWAEGINHNGPGTTWMWVGHPVPSS